MRALEDYQSIGGSSLCRANCVIRQLISALFLMNSHVNNAQHSSSKGVTVYRSVLSVSAGWIQMRLCSIDIGNRLANQM